MRQQTHFEVTNKKPIIQTLVGVQVKFTLPREMECTKKLLFPNTLPWKCLFLHRLEWRVTSPTTVWTFTAQERRRTTDGQRESGITWVWGRGASAITCSYCCMAGRVMDSHDVQGTERRRKRKEEADARRGQLRNDSGEASVSFSDRSFFYH